MTDATILIRAKNEAEHIGRTLDLLAAQTAPHAVVLVDSGSTDDTVAIACDRGIEPIEIAAESFTYGRALNIGTEAARTPIVVALSAHAFPREDEWLAKLLAHFRDPSVACASGDLLDEHGAPLTDVHRQDADAWRRNPRWGYSNVAGGYRRDLWTRHPFREDLPFSEDKEWAGWALGEGYVCVVDPELVVEHDHTADPLPARYRRMVDEHRAYRMFIGESRYGVREALGDWWRADGDDRAPWRARASVGRAVEIAGKWRGSRAGLG